MVVFENLIQVLIAHLCFEIAHLSLPFVNHNCILDSIDLMDDIEVNFA